MFGASYTNAGSKMKEPFITISRINAPVIDGNVEKKEWNNAVQITNFLKVDGTAPAKEQTFCRIGYDDNNLYFGCKMQAWALDPASNQRHTFKSKVKKYKGPVWDDDSIELRFSMPGNPLKVFFIAINANAAVHPLIIKYKSGGAVAGMLPWTPKIQAKAKINDGFWSFELKIPFSELGVHPGFSKFGRLCVDRFEKRLSENSAWSNMRGSLLNPKGFGWYVFTDKRMGIAPDEIPVLRPGENHGNIKIYTVEPQIVTFSTTVIFEDGTTEKKEKYYRLKKASYTNLKSSFKIINPTKNWVQFTIADKKGKVLYQTKPLRRPDSNSYGKVPEIAFSGKVYGSIDIYLNGKKYPLNAKFKKSLNPGLNTLMLFIPAGANCKGKFKIGTQIFALDSGWKYKLSNEPLGLSLDSNTRKWVEYSPKIMAQNKSGGICLQKVILAGASKTFPQFIDNTLYMSVNGTYGFQVNVQSCPPSVPAMKVDNLKYFIEVPEGITLVGACGRVGKISRFPQSIWKNRNIYSWRDLGVFVRTESGRPEKYRRYRIERQGKALLTDKNPRYGRYDRCTIALKAGAETKKWISKDAKKIFFRIEADNGYIQETNNVLFLKMLPQLAGKAPRKIKFDVGGMVQLYRFMADDKLILEVAKTLHDAGFNQMMYDGFQDIQGKTGVATYWFYRYTGYADVDNLIYIRDVLKHFPQRYVGQNGAKHPQSICWDALLDTPDAVDAFKDAVKAYYKKLPYQSMLFEDYEYPAYAKDPKKIYRVNACFCPYSLKRFRKKMNIPEPVSIELIGKKYLKQWIDYQCTRVAEQMRLGYEASHECGKAFSSYSAYQSDYTISHYTFDYRKTGRWVDQASAGYGRPLNAIKATRKALKGKPLLGGVLSIPVNKVISPPAILLRRILDCGGGVLCWWEDAYDARKLHQVAQASTLVAEYEDFFLAGALSTEKVESLIESPSLDNIYLCKHQNRYLLILLNENQLPAQIPVKFLKALKSIKYALNKKSLKVQPKLTIPIKGGSYEALIFELK